jgi:hypothetical protein
MAAISTYYVHRVARAHASTQCMDICESTEASTATTLKNAETRQSRSRDST